MKKRLLVGCSALALSASGAFAADFNSANDYYYAPPAQTTAAGIFGDINLSATYFGGDVMKDVSLNLGGTVTLPFGNGWNAAIKHGLSYFFDAHHWEAGGEAHIFYATANWAAGAFLAGDTEHTYGIGVDAAAFVNNFDVVARAGYASSSPDFWEAGLKTNIYFDPNTAITLGLGGLWYNGGDDAWQAEIGIEHRFNSSPVSAYADLAWTGSGGADVYAITGGARVVFGDAGPTLQDFNRRNPF